RRPRRKSPPCRTQRLDPDRGRAVSGRRESSRLFGALVPLVLAVDARGPQRPSAPRTTPAVVRLPSPTRLVPNFLVLGDAASIGRSVSAGARGVFSFTRLVATR